MRLQVRSCGVRAVDVWDRGQENVPGSLFRRHSRWRGSGIQSERLFSTLLPVRATWPASFFAIAALTHPHPRFLIAISLYHTVFLIGNAQSPPFPAQWAEN